MASKITKIIKNMKNQYAKLSVKLCFCTIVKLFIIFYISYLNSEGSLGVTSVLTPMDAAGMSDAEVSQQVIQIPSREFTLPGGTSVSVKDATFYTKKADGTIMPCTYLQFILQNMHAVCLVMFRSNYIIRAPSTNMV